MTPTNPVPLARVIARAIHRHQVAAAVARIMRAFPGTTVEERGQ